jgi:hypothetical protein
VICDDSIIPVSYMYLYGTRSPTPRYGQISVSWWRVMIVYRFSMPSVSLSFPKALGASKGTPLTVDELEKGEDL